LNLRDIATLALLTALTACKREAVTTPTPPQTQAIAAPVQEADPIVARVDLTDIHLSQVRERLGQTAATEQREAAIAMSLVAAVQDGLVVREMAVLKALPQPGETNAHAADRFLAGVWKANPTCVLDPRDLRFAYLRDLGKYKHPASFTVWDAQFQCCPDVDQCPLLQSEACRKVVNPQAQALATEIRKALATLPALGAAADVTSVTVEQSPLKDKHIPAFEQAVATWNAREPRLQLRRYTFFRQGEKGFEKARFQPGEPHVEQAVQGAKLGDVLGPIETAWGVDVVLLVAREPLRAGLDDEAVVDQVRKRACEEAAQIQRIEYRTRLLAGARLEWRKAAIEQAFGKAVVRKLPPDATARELPHIAPGL
jgi:hypothetical protein